MDDRRVLRRASLLAALLVPAWAYCAPPQGPLPSPTHTVIVVLENRSARQVYDNPDTPYLQSLVAAGARMTNAGFAQTPYARVPRGAAAPLPARPSQPNYLYLFSGSNQGVLPSYFEDASTPVGSAYIGTATHAANGDLLATALAGVATGIANRLVPASMRPFTTPNLAAAVRAHGGSFAVFSESLPYPRFDGETFDGGDGLYKRKHNPVIDWIPLPGTNEPAPDKARFVLPEEANLAFTPTVDPASGARYRGFATDADGKSLGFENLPSVSIVVPNQAHDAHDGSLRSADEWLRANIAPYEQWARTHGALLVVTFDEDGATDTSHGDGNRTGTDRIATIFVGPMVRPSRYDEPIDHLNVLATVLALHADLEAFRTDFATAHPGEEGERERENLRPIVDIFGAGSALEPIRWVTQ